MRDGDDLLGQSGQLDDETEAKLVAALDEFAGVFQATGGSSDSEEAVA